MKISELPVASSHRQRRLSVIGVGLDLRRQINPTSEHYRRPTRSRYTQTDDSGVFASSVGGIRNIRLIEEPESILLKPAPPSEPEQVLPSRGIDWRERITLLGRYAGLFADFSHSDLPDENTFGPKLYENGDLAPIVRVPQLRYEFRHLRDDCTSPSVDTTTENEYFLPQQEAKQPIIRITSASAEKSDPGNRPLDSAEVSSMGTSHIEELRLQVVSPGMGEKNFITSPKPAAFRRSPVRNGISARSKRNEAKSASSHPQKSGDELDEHNESGYLPQIRTPEIQTFAKTVEKTPNRGSGRNYVTKPRDKPVVTSNQRNASVAMENAPKLRNGTGPRRNSAAAAVIKSSSPHFRSEVYKLERGRDDLIRRNQYLQKQILSEQEDLRNVEASQKIDELGMRNHELLEERDEARHQEHLAKERLAGSELSQKRVMDESSDSCKEIKGSEKMIGEMKKELDRLNYEQKKLLEAGTFADDKLRSLELEIRQVKAESEQEVLLRNGKENDHDESMEKLNELKQLLLATEIENRSKSSRNSRTKETIQSAKDKHCKVNESLEKLERKIDVLSKTSAQVSAEVDGAREQSEQTLKLLTEAQRRFRKREEARMNMKDRSCQTDGRLVALRDIAWIRIAEEEVILSPHCGTARAGFQRNEQSPTNVFHLGSVMPVFEVYEAPQQGKLPAMTSADCVTCNKRLVDASGGREYMWVAEE